MTDRYQHAGQSIVKMKRAALKAVLVTNIEAFERARAADKTADGMK